MLFFFYSCTHTHTQTHMSPYRNMEVHTGMMSGSPTSLLFLPSLRVFPHSAGRSWVFLQADAGLFYTAIDAAAKMLSVTGRGGIVFTSLSVQFILFLLLCPTPSAENSEPLQQPLEEGGEAQDGLEYARMRKSLQPKKEQAPLL